jgi:hypothetical protein
MDKTTLLPLADRTTVDAIERAICAEHCAFFGEPPCWQVTDDHGEALLWPNPDCDEPGCHSLAQAAAAALRARAEVARLREAEIKRNRLLAGWEAAASLTGGELATLINDTEEVLRDE